MADKRLRQTTWPEIDKHREYIGAMLAAGVSKATIWQRLRDEHGLTASVASLKRYVAANLPGARTASASDGAAGRSAARGGQIDYGYLGGGPTRSVAHAADLGGS